MEISSLLLNIFRFLQINEPSKQQYTQQTAKHNHNKKHLILIENNISIDSEIEEFNNNPNNNELELQQQLRYHHRQQQKKNIHLQQQQEIVFTNQLKYSNKVANNNDNTAAFPNNVFLNPSHLQQNYQNLNYNIDYQNYEPFVKSKNLITSNHHLKHIENVYKQSNMMQHNNGTLSATNLGVHGSNNSIDNDNSDEQDGKYFKFILIG